MSEFPIENKWKDFQKKTLPLVQKQKFHCNYKITLNISFGENIDILVLSLPQTIPLNPMLKLARFFCVNLKVPDFNLLRHGHFFVTLKILYQYVLQCILNVTIHSFG